MARRYYRKKKQDTDMGGIYLFLLVIAALVLGPHKEWIPYVLYATAAFFALLVVAFAYRKYKKIQLKYRLAVLDDIDIMDGIEFEEYVTSLLKRHGFKNVRLTEKYDMGVDIVAEKEGQRWGVQAKRYTGLVKASAVRQVVAGLNSYNCDKAMVITNSTFSNYAIKLARSNHCILIDRMELAKLINDTK